MNFFLACVGVVQLSRIFLWQKSQKGVAPVEGKVEKVAGTVEGVVDGAKGAVKDAVK